MEDQEINADVIEEVIKSSLIELGLQPNQIEGCIDVGYPHFHIARGNCEIGYKEEAQEYFAAVELNANIKHPNMGDFVISDLTTARGKSPELAFEAATKNYLKVTFPAIRALFDEKIAKELQEASNIKKIKSFTDGVNRFVEWQIFTGELQILKDLDGSLKDYLSNTWPLVMFFESITGYFGEPQIHWCKFYISKQGDDLLVGCSIDGFISEEAKAEIYSKFKYEGPAGYEIRQFFVFKPLGFLDEGDSAREELLNYHKKSNTKPEKTWWKFWKRDH